MQRSNKLVINFTPTGMVPTKDMNANVPISVQEIVEQVHEVSEIGITLVHLHARDEDTGIPTWKSEVYHKIIQGVRHHCPSLVIGVSLSGRNFNEFEKRSEVLSLQPDMGSLTLSSLNFTQQASVNSPEMIQQLALAMKEQGVHPELEVFDVGMIHYGLYMIEKKILEPPFYWNIIAGNITGIQADLIELGMAIRLLPRDSWWALGGIGRQQLTANMIALAMGGGVRVGLEDNLYFDVDRKILATNKDMVQRIHQIAAHIERPIMLAEAFGNAGFYNTNRRPG